MNNNNEIIEIRDNYNPRYDLRDYLSKSNKINDAENSMYSKNSKKNNSKTMGSKESLSKKNKLFYYRNI